jgi:lysozyme
VRPVPTQICLPLIHTFEGAAGEPHTVPRQDPVGNWEIGWSHKLTSASDMPGPITRAEADALALADLDTAADAVIRVIGEDVAAELTDGQYGALVDFTYNLGEGNFARSTLARLVRVGNFVMARGEFGKWVYGKTPTGHVVLEGLVRRRKSEAALWIA